MKTIDELLSGVKWFVCLMALLYVVAAPMSVSAGVPKLTVSGNKVLVGGQYKSMGGNSFFWSNTNWGGEKYYNVSVVAWLKNDWKSSIVRAAMGIEKDGGYFQDPAANKARVRAVVDAAIANDMYVIIDWHSHVAETQRDAAVAFFREMAQLYGQYNNVIYEVYNEPLQDVSWTGVIKPYAESVIAAIRQYDPDNLIVVGTPTWSQRVDEASWNPINGSNIAYALHFYAGSHGEVLRQKARTAMNNGIALFVTEWGAVNANGDGAVNYAETDAWVSFMWQYGIHHVNWSINDKSEGASALYPGSSPSGGWTSLTASGNKARDIVRNSDKPTPDTVTEIITLKSMANNQYVCADNYGKNPLIANRTVASTWEKFEKINLGNGTFAFKSLANGKYVCADNYGNSSLIANRDAAKGWESFRIVDMGAGRVALKAVANNKFVCAENAGNSPLIANRTAALAWETFVMTIVQAN